MQAVIIENSCLTLKTNENTQIESPWNLVTKISVLTLKAP